MTLSRPLRLDSNWLNRLPADPMLHDWPGSARQAVEGVCVCPRLLRLRKRAERHPFCSSLSRPNYGPFFVWRPGYDRDDEFLRTTSPPQALEMGGHFLLGWDAVHGRQASLTSLDRVLLPAARPT